MDIEFVQGDRVHPPWGYTVGLTLRGLPELVVTGLRAPEGGDLLNDFADGVVHHGERLSAGQRLRCPHGSEMEVVELPHPDAHLFTAVSLFPPKRRVLQRFRKRLPPLGVRGQLTS